jgi:peptidoglycan/xylan/chitin deacetylase (PgdA/CDA1 family)
MHARLTIVNYHYVRDLRRSRFPEIKGLSTGQFREQVDYIRQHYTIIGGGDLIEAASGGEAVPPRALLMTFDDGYSDHFTQVFPILDELRLPGCFFPPARPILEDCVLDVNKIHFVLAAVPDKAALVEHVFSLLNANRQRFGLPTNDAYWQRFAVAGRYDPAEVMFLKRLLQRGLPPALRQIILNDLFGRYVSRDEAAFARELYMSPDQLRCLQRHGLTLGSHGYNHAWLDSLTPDEQAEEIDRSLAFLATLGVQPGPWIMSYPYGAHNESLLGVLAARGCAAAVTTEIGLADLARQHPLTLPRLDTNDLPRDAAEARSPWTMQVAV